MVFLGAHPFLHHHEHEHHGELEALDQALELRIEQDADGKSLLPDLAKLAPSLCFEARRRVQSFLGYCSRTNTPIPALPAHSPSLTVLVPVYGETIIRSWPDMFKEQLVGVGLSAGMSTSLTNLEYMVERQNKEFRCLAASLSDGERRQCRKFCRLTGLQDVWEAL